MAMLDKAPGPRIIKSHLPINLLPNELWTVNPKIIYTAINAKDTAIFLYHHYRGIRGHNGTIDQFLDAFLKEKLFYGDYFGHVHDFMRVHLRTDEIRYGECLAEGL